MAWVIFLLVLGVMGALVWASASIRSGVYLKALCEARTEERKVALTFDDGPDEEMTPRVLALLRRYRAQATFFVVGEWVDKYPESVKALHDAGHEVMNHSDVHPHMSKMSARDIVAEVTAANDKIEAVTGVRPTLFRCPYGEYDDNVVGTINGMGMQVIQWNVDSLDWKDLDADEIYDRVTSRMEPGSIVLFHNAAKHTPEALPSILENLLSEGYSLVPVSQLLLEGEYYIDHTGKQCLQ